MLKAITKEDFIDTDGRVDVCAFMRSDEIREYMRANKIFRFKDKIRIILRSMNPYGVKVEALKLLAEEPGMLDLDRLYTLGVISYIERIFQEIESPEKPAVFVLNTCYPKEKESVYSDWGLYGDCSWPEYFRSYQGFCNRYDNISPTDISGVLLRHRIDIVYPRVSKGDNPLIRFWVTWFENGYEIYSIEADPDWGREHLFSEEITEELAGIEFNENVSLYEYTFPFQSMSKVQIMTPFMRKPVTGIWVSDTASYSGWRYYFYPEKDGKLSGNYILLFEPMLEDGNLVIFDWMSSIEDEVTPEEFQEIYADKCKVTPINDIKVGETVTVVARIMRVVELNSYDSIHAKEICLEVADDSASTTIRGVMLLDTMDWIEKAVNEHKWIWINSTVNKDDEDDKLYISLGLNSIIDEKIVKYFKNGQPKE